MFLESPFPCAERPLPGAKLRSINPNKCGLFRLEPGTIRRAKINIYLHIEVLLRELDSRLLLAVLAASRDHKVFLADISSLQTAAKKGTLTPGVLLTKSLTPSEKKLIRHNVFQSQSIAITSIDEESGLANVSDYEVFSRQRYSDDTLQQASAAFCWGDEDTEALKRVFPQHASKIFKSGSPRVDLWRPRFREYWQEFAAKPGKPYLLVSSNMTANLTNPLHVTIQGMRKSGYFSRDEKEFYRLLGLVAEQWKLIVAFAEAIENLSKKTSGFDIVLRPHPTENTETWKALLHGMPNVHVIREGGITSWVNDAFAVMHNGCTTAFEATIAGTPALAYTPFPQEYEMKAPNDLSKRISNPDELVDEVTKIFDTHQASKGTIKDAPSLPRALVEKIYIDEEELAADKIIRVWESLEIEDEGKKTDWRRFRRVLIRKKIRSFPAMLFHALGGRSSQRSYSSQKFPGFDLSEIRAKVERLVGLLDVHDTIQVKRLSKTVILVKKVSG